VRLAPGQNLPSNSRTIEIMLATNNTALVLTTVCKRQYLLAAQFLILSTAVLHHQKRCQHDSVH
jgi:hypothetical protein